MQPLNIREINRLLDQMEPEVAAAFRVAMEQIATDVNIGQLEAALREADLQAAIRAVGIETATYTALTEEVRRVYLQAGQAHAMATPKSVRFGFDMQNPRAERWIRQNAATMVEIMRNEQRQVVVDAIRDVVERGVAAGSGPRKMALELAGRIDRGTGRRVGGRIVLNSQQSQWVANMARELRSGSPNVMSNYFSRSRRDRRFDGIVRRAMEAGKAVDEADVTRLVGRYSDRLLESRARIIARTETNRAFQEAADESLRQLIDGGHVRRESVKRVWDATMDMVTRPTHAAANGQKRGIDEPFNVGGHAMMHPHDPSAPAEETVACFAPWSLVAVSGLKSAIRSHYVGDLVKVSAGGVVDFTVTPNHPILTQRGWIGAGFLVEGDQLIDCGVADRFFIGREPEVSNAVTSAQNLYDSAESLGVCRRAGFGSVNFHGEVPTEDVDVVSLDRRLRDRFDSSIAERFGHFTLADTDVSLGRTIFDRILGSGNGVLPIDPNRPVSSLDSSGAVFRGHETGRPSVAFRYIRALYTKVLKTLVNRPSTDADFSRYPENRVSRMEEPRDFSEVMGSFFSGAFHSLLSAFFNVVRFVRGEPEVVEAACHEAVGFTDIIGYGGGGFSRFEENTDPIKERFSGFPESLGCGLARVGVVDTFHYDGPVYNFETDNGLIVTGNTIAHNCRCVLRQEIDYLAEAL